MNPVYTFSPLRRTNMQAIAELANLGVLRDELTLDLTIGPEAGFWKLWRPTNLVTNDIDADVDAHYHHDATALPFPDSAFPQVVYDPPYAFRGSAKRGNDWDGMDLRYGTSEYRSVAQTMALLLDGLAEAIRVSSRLVLLKCMDQNVSSRYTPQTYPAMQLAASLGAKLLTELHVFGARKQPADKAQKNPWVAHSTLMVFGVQ